ncbi:hypothetical protein AR454_05580 [Bacillus mycoides]|uniref:hypothetical protein n=1 Tax=Bacillus mycoides TaxID=1405 RepID=UPI001E4AB995|nr:hypothetical protein [Bacillus mycoides]MCD4646204.1 hypothetical protein [Bacillus mycoides]
MSGIRTYDTVSNRVLLAEFDKNWNRRLSDGHVVYTATSNDAKVDLILLGGQTQTLVFKECKTIFVEGNTFHFSPHVYYING